MLLFGIILYLLAGSHDLATGCSSKSSRMKDEFDRSIWKFQTDFIENMETNDISQFVYSPHSATISLIAMVFGGDIKFKLAKFLNLNFEDFAVPLNESNHLIKNLKIFVRLSQVSDNSKPILHTKYVNHVNSTCELNENYNDVLELLNIGKFEPKALANHRSIESLVTDELTIKISNIAEICRVKKSHRLIHFHSQNVKRGIIKSLNGVEFYVFPYTGSGIGLDDDVKMIIILPCKTSLARLKEDFSKLQYSDLIPDSETYALTFSMGRPKHLNTVYNFSSYFTHKNIALSHKHSDIIPANFGNICGINDEFRLHGYVLKQFANLHLDDSDLNEALLCTEEQRQINIELPENIMILIVAKKSILLVAST